MQTPAVTTPAGTPDSQLHWLTALLPVALRPFAVLARLDRPIGWQLLYGPCVWGVLIAGDFRRDWPLLGWFLLGAVAMRGAGCVYNDIVDRDIDRLVARTQARPLASGAISLKAAWGWLLVLCLGGLVVLLQLTPFAASVAVSSLILVAVYPFMKRITWWPQAWLGIVFSWGALVAGAAVTGRIGPVIVLLYCGSIAWVVGYDTIYALQDVDDDALIGVRSSARRLGSRVKSGIAGFYALALACWAAAFWCLRPDPLVLAALLPVGIHFAWQAMSVRPDDGLNALTRFRSNRFAGLLVAMACLVVRS